MPISEPKIPEMFYHSSHRTRGAAMAAVTALTDDGLFIGQSAEFFALLRDLAEDADEPEASRNRRNSWRCC